MRKRILSLLLAFAMLFAFATPIAMAEGVGTLAIDKMVVEGDVKTPIVDWLMANNTYSSDIFNILGSMSFELYRSDTYGTKGALAANGAIENAGKIVFSSEISAGWYLISEVLGEPASDIFIQPDDLLVYFNGTNISGFAKPSQAFPEGTSFTIQQFYGSDVSRPVQVIYESGFYLRTTPALDVPGAPNDGGSALATSKFIATANDGTHYTSFCADIGAVGVKGTYYVDETKHGFTDAQMHQLVAAIDYINDTYDLNNNYEALALAQLVVWNMILQNNNDGPFISDNWIRNGDDFWLYTDAFGKIVKIEGYNNTDGSNPWYTAEYKALIDGIIANPGIYTERYDAKLASGIGSYVSNATFLVGDKSFDDIFQQRQLLIQFDEPEAVTFDNIPGYLQGDLKLQKMVVDNELKVAIVEYLVDEGLAHLAVDILEDITFELYASNENGDQMALVADGTVDASGVIKFSPSVGKGWYLVHEVLGDLAGQYFAQAEDLLIYYNGKYASIGTGYEIPRDAEFTVQQFFGVGRPVQAIYEKGFYLRQAPALDVPGAPNGGGELATSKFIATEVTSENENQYTSFCADIGAVGVKGTYKVDETNHGFNQREMRRLVAALDYINGRYNFAEDDEALALAQLVVWNMILQYDEGSFISDSWIRNRDDFWLYTDAFGKIVKIEGYNNTNGSNPWYTPEYKALIDDILANPDDYVSLYDEKVARGEDTFISGATFLVGDKGALEIYQQRQVIVQFQDPVSFDNMPRKGDLTGTLSLQKVVIDNDIEIGIIAYLSGLDLVIDEIQDILADITFELYESNENGEKLSDAVASGNADLTGTIHFSPEVVSGWYLVHEVLGTTAAGVFEQADDLLIYYNGETAVGSEGEDSFVNTPVVKNDASIYVTAEVITYEADKEWVPNKKTVSGTLVSYVGKSDADKKSNGYYNAFGDYIDNTQGGFTAVAVNVDGPNERIFDISKSGSGNPKSQAESDKIGLMYTVEVVSGNIVVTFDENFVSAKIAYGVYTSVSDIKWAPGQYNVSKGHVSNTSGVIQIPLPQNAAGVVYLAIHIDGATFCDGTGSWVETGRTEIPYTGALKLEITGPDGYSDVTDFFGTDTISPLKPGEYTITLSGEGFDSVSKTVTVEEGETVAVEFGKIIVE